VFLEKLTVAQQDKFPTFCQSQKFIPCSQQSSTGLYPEPKESIMLLYYIDNGIKMKHLNMPDSEERLFMVCECCCWLYYIK
jgi:hypothetical protein